MDEEEAIKTEYCSNCRRDIPAANFVMHVTHCQRNLTLCKICGEPVPTSQQEEHFGEYHAQEKCECGQLVEKMNLEDHKEKDCPNRGVECQYCELTLPFNKMESHVEYCGSRTEKCDACGRFIQMKDFTEHENTGCQYPVKEESKKLPSNPPPDFFPGMPIDMLHAMGLDPSGNSPATDFFHPALAAGMREFGQILNTGLGTSPFSGGAAYFGGIAASNGVIDRQDVIARGAKGGRAFPKSEFDQDTFQDFDKVDDEFAQDVDDDEMLAAAFQADEFDNLNGHANGMSSAMVDEPFPYAKFTSMADSQNDANKTQLPCEFCGDLFPVDNLILHQSACQLRSLDSFPGSAAHFPDESTEHDLPQLNNSNFSRDRKSRTNHTELGTKGRNRSEDDTFLPCEFCQELFPFDNLIAHQAVCDACPASRPPSALFDGSTQGPPLNNARPSVRNGTKSRPSRPVYESKKTQRPLTDFIPSELEDGDDLDFTPSVNDDLTTRDASRKPEKYCDENGVLDSAPMNNELQRQERRTGEGHSMRGQTVLRNNDLSNRQPAAVRVKNGTADLSRKRETGPRTGLDTSYKAPAVKPAEERLGQKKLNVGSRGRPAAELVAKASRVQTSDGATGAKPRLPIMNDELIERSRRDSDHKLNMPQSHKSEPRASKPRRVDAGSGGVKSDSSSAMRVTAPRSNRTKGAEPLPPISKAISVNGSSLHSAPSNPRRNPPTTSSLEQGVRSNRGRPRQQGSVEPVRSSNTPPASTSVPRKTSSTRKKIV